MIEDNVIKSNLDWCYINGIAFLLLIVYVLNMLTLELSIYDRIFMYIFNQDNCTAVSVNMKLPWSVDT